MWGHCERCFECDKVNKEKEDMLSEFGEDEDEDADWLDPWGDNDEFGTFRPPG